MSDRKQANAKQKAEYPHDEMVAGNFHEKKSADTATDTERKPLPLEVAGISARAWDTYLHSHILVLNIPVVANDTQGKGGTNASELQ